MKNALKILLYFVFIIICLNYFSNIFGMKKAESVKILGNRENTSIYFVGSSAILRDVSPMEIYNSTGITSNNIAVSWSQMSLDSYLIKDNYNSQLKVILLDMESFFQGCINNKDHFHYEIDSMPLDINKLIFINSKEWNFSLFDKLSFAFPILRFHDKWSDFNEMINQSNNEKCNVNNCYGYLNLSNVFRESNDNYMLENSQPNIINNYNNNWVIKIKNYCEKHDIKLVLFMPPYQLWSVSKYDDLSKWAKIHDLDYIDLNVKYDETKINLKTDFFDAGHLNISGATKVSDYLAKYLKDNYDLPDHRGDTNYKSWDEDAIKYNEYKAKYMDEYNNNLKKLESNKGN